MLVEPTPQVDPSVEVLEISAEVIAVVGVLGVGEFPSDTLIFQTLVRALPMRIRVGVYRACPTTNVTCPVLALLQYEPGVTHAVSRGSFPRARRFFCRWRCHDQRRWRCLGREWTFSGWECRQFCSCPYGIVVPVNDPVKTGRMNSFAA